MPKLVRIYWGQFNGVVDCTLYDNDIIGSSVVLASVCEGDDGKNSESERRRFLGDAKMQVDNIAPFDGGVKIRLTIDWDDPLNIWTDVVIMDGFPPLVRAS
jgi:hypothetical protein